MISDFKLTAEFPPGSLDVLPVNPSPSTTRPPTHQKPTSNAWPVSFMNLAFLGSWR
jgi:hypothetical protein